MTPRGLVSASLVVLAGSCGPGEPGPLPDPPAGYGHAVAMSDCAPWDGIATSIFLSAVPFPLEPPFGPEAPTSYLVLSIYEVESEIAGKRFEVDRPREAGASRCSENGECAPAASGWVRIRTVGTDRTITGDFSITFDAEPAITGSFEANWWENRRILCG